MGNIYRSGLIQAENISITEPVSLNPAQWEFNEGMSKPYSGRGTGKNAFDGEFEFSKQTIAFEDEGSFFFKADQPEAVQIKNWNELGNELIIKLTQTHYSFRAVYVVTEVATASDWTLAISEAKDAELELANNSENFGLIDLFGMESTRTIQSKNMAYYNRKKGRSSNFFKAKKLVVRQDKIDVFASELIAQNSNVNTWADRFFDYSFAQDNNPYLQVNSHGENVLDFLPAGQLNPNTALSYFEWDNANLDDIDKLF